MKVLVSGLSDVGKVRSHNEDSFELDPEHHLFIVADGMGGHGHGEVASQIAAEAIRNSVGQGLVPVKAGGWFSSRPEPRQSPPELLEDAMVHAHERILAAIEEDSRLTGMGTTAVGVMLEDGVCTVAHVGDSRVYRYRGGNLEQLTEDHTWVNEQVLAGFLSQEQARSHPLKSVVTRAVGGEGRIQVDVRQLELHSDDQFLLCSDGLTGMLTDEQIRECLEAGAPLEETCLRLIEGANEAGGLDNITVVLISVESPD